MTTSTAGGDYAAFTRFVAHRDDQQLPYLRIVQDEDADTVKLPRCWLLDAPSDPNPLLDQLMHDALLGIYLSSDGATARFDLAGKGRQKAPGESKAPVSSTAGDIGHLQRSYEQSRTHRARLLVIKEAQTIVTRFRYARKVAPADVRGTDEWKAEVAADTRSLREVARAYEINHQTVANYRRSHGVSKELRKSQSVSKVPHAATAA